MAEEKIIYKESEDGFILHAITYHYYWHCPLSYMWNQIYILPVRYLSANH